MEVALSDNVINNDSKFNNKPSGFVQTEDTPNPNTIKFFPAGGKVLKEGIEEYTSKDEACESDLAYHLFSIENVDRVFLTTTFVSITKKEESSWDSIKVDIIAAIGGYFAKHTRRSHFWAKKTRRKRRRVRRKKTKPQWR